MKDYDFSDDELKSRKWMANNLTPLVRCATCNTPMQELADFIHWCHRCGAALYRDGNGELKHHEPTWTDVNITVKDSGDGHSNIGFSPAEGSGSWAISMWLNWTPDNANQPRES